MTAQGMLAAGVTAAVLAAGGCGPSVEDGLRKELDAARQKIVELERSNAELKAATAEKEKQIAGLQALGEKRLDRLYHVESIRLGRYTGGVNLDDRDGDDAVKVYLQPIDQDGSVLKAAGSVTIELFDLAAEPERNRIGRYEWSVEQVSKQWHSGFLTYHYSLECPWRDAPPAHPDLTVRVVFLDYLTGKQFTAQTTCTVKLPPVE